MTEVTEKTHAVLSPSGYSRWSACPGSVELEKPFPNSGSKYARYGTAAHELADICLTKQEDAEIHVGRTFVVEGHEIEVDMAMADLVNEYVSYVGTFLDRSAGDIILPEQQVPLTHMTGEKDATGTSDVVGFRKRPDGKWTMVIVDMKTGAGVPVFAKGNGQLRMYAGGALEKFGLLYDVADVQMVIVQPPLHIVDDETLTVDELRAFMDEVAIAAGRTQTGNAELVPGEKQCRFCRAKSTCPALRDEVMATVTVSTASSFRSLDDAPDAMPKLLAAEIKTADDAALLAAQMRSLKLVEEWCKAVRAEVERRTFAGEMPGYKIVQGKAGNRQWGDEEAALAALKKVPTLKIDDVAPRKLASPTVAEKLLKADPKRWSKIAPLITQEPGKPSVAPESDPRPAYEVVSSAYTFAAIARCENPLTESTAKVTPDVQALLS
ncbi:MAG TPA: DUF2800 domain-containing protein [Sphingomonas sp.]|jgi:hypothetical protein